MFAANLVENLLALEGDLKDGSFVPFPLRRKFIPKEPGKFRPLGIPTVSSYCTSFSRVLDTFVVDPN